MSDLCMNEFVDIAWGEFCLSGDHIVPDPGNKWLNDHFILEGSHKKRNRDLISNSSSTGDRSASKYADQTGDQRGISPLRKRRNMMLEKDSWVHKSDISFTSAFDNNPVKDAPRLASDNAISSSHALTSNKRNSNSSEFCGLDSILDEKTSITDNNSIDYPMGDITHTGNGINYFENAENKDSSDLLYSDWPEIENFEDIDRMFRSCDSTFGLGICREGELGWLSSDATGETGDVLKSDDKFPYPVPNGVENMSENHDFSNGYSINNSSKISAPLRYKDSSWTSDNSDSYSSVVIGPDRTECKDGFIIQEQDTRLDDKIQPSMLTESHFRTGSGAVTNEHKIRIKQHQQHALTPDSYSHSQNPISYMHSDNRHLSDQSSVYPKPFVVKSETNDVTSISPRDSSHASSQLQCLDCSPHPGFKAAALAMCEQRKRLHCSQGSLSSLHDSQKEGSVTIQASIPAPGMGGKPENHYNTEGVSLSTPSELGSSNMPESSATGSDLDDISLEAASFRQLHLVLGQLDLRMKLCIRDSLYRLARSAEQRHNLANLNTGCGGDTSTKSFMDMETDTNPIDRSVAHLLFHRPTGSPTIPAQDSFPLKSSSVVHGSVASQPVLGDNWVCDENVSEVQKTSNC